MKEGKNEMHFWDDRFRHFMEDIIGYEQIPEECKSADNPNDRRGCTVGRTGSVVGDIPAGTFLKAYWSACTPEL